MLGVSFKENCPDIRNSKVLDIIKELEEYECSVDVCDYWVDKNSAELEHLNFINDIPYDSKKYDAIIVAVGHDKFKTITNDEYKNMSKTSKILIDVKGIVEDPTWRL